MKIESHPFEPFLPTGARILFLGSFPPQPHRWCMPFYYPNWINDFWRIMGFIFFGDKNHFCVTGEKRFDETLIREFCTLEGLAFYDTSCAYPLPLEKKADAYRQLFQPKKLILWDLDGTLIDTLEDLGDAVNHALTLQGLPLHTVAEYRRMVGHGVRNLVTQALPQELQADDAYIDAALAEFKEYYSAHIDVHTRPYPGMQDLLADLSAAGVRMAVTSNKFQEGTERLIREFFPSVNFVAILGNRPGYPLKPSPEIVEEVLNAAEVSRSDAILVGDSPTDMRTASNGGIGSIAVSWGYRSVEELAGNRIVHSVSELRAALLPRR